MSGFFSHFQFGQALFFALLVLLPLLWLGRGRLSRAAILWRSLVLGLLIFALADPREIEETPARAPAGERIFAFDLSQSVPEAMRLWMARQNIAPRAGDRVFVFGGAAEETKDWQRRLKGEAASEGIKPGQTNLEALFSALLTLPRRGRSVFLFTDGWQTEGDAARLLPSLAAAGIKVYPVLPPEPPAAPNVAVKKIVAPGTAARGEAFSLKVVVENDDRNEIEGNLVLTRNGQPFRSEAVRLKPGSQIFGYETLPGDGPLLSLQAEFAPRRAGADRFAGDNRASAWVAVRSKEKVLLLSGRSGEGAYLETLLKRRGFEVASATASAAPPAPAGYGMVVLNNVQKDTLAPAYLAAIERHVSAGNGLLVLGDESGLPAGAYRQTPLGAALPIEIVEPKQEEKSRAVVVVIDKSRSMEDERRLVYAKEAAKAAVGQLRDEDFIGAIGFDTEAFAIVPLTPVKNIRATFAAQIDRLTAGGNTRLLPALKEAAAELRKQPADRKHVIVLTDADKLPDSPAALIDLVVSMKDELKITVSAVAIGNRPDVPLMTRLAKYGGGFFHHTNDPSSLPQIVAQQVPRQASEPRREERNIVPVAARGSEMLAGLPETFPPVKGYVEAELKKGARADLILPHEGKNSPLLASWSYGKGRAAVFTADQAGRWSKDWIRWSGLERFWGKAFDWLRPGREILPAHEVKINLVENRPVLDFYLYSQESDGNTFHYAYTGGRGVRGEGVLKRLAPGHYQSELPLALPGDYQIALKEERSGRTVGYPIVGYTLPVQVKGDVFVAGFNMNLLERIAGATGGAINPGAEPEQMIGPTTARVTFLRSYFIFLAALFFLLEVFFRRFRDGKSRFS